MPGSERSVSMKIPFENPVTMVEFGAEGDGPVGFFSAENCWTVPSPVQDPPEVKVCEPGVVPFAPVSRDTQIDP